MYPATWHCDEIYSGDVPPAITGQDCIVTSYASSTEATTTSEAQSYNGANYHDWLFVSGIIVFLVSYMFWGRLFKPIKTPFDE